MKKKTRLILLTIIGALIVLLVALGLSYAYMHNNVSEGSHSKIGANSCAKILLMEKSNSINLTNSFPMSENAGLNTDPYSFGVRSTCSGNRGFKLYIVTIAGNTISANNIRFALTPKGEKEILSSGIVGQLSSGSSDYNATQTTQLSNSVGTVDSIYYAYEDNIELGQTTYYDLYMWVDKDATTSVANKSFTAAVAILEGQYFDTDIAVRLAGNINTYDADVTCTVTSDAGWNPLTRQVEVFDITQKPTNCTVRTKANTNLGNLKNIVEANGTHESGYVNYQPISFSNYTMGTPFYGTGSTSTSGTDEAGAISWDSTNNYWVTNPQVTGMYYKYSLTLSEPGYYQICYKLLGDVTSNRLFLYKNSDNFISDRVKQSGYYDINNSNDICVGYDYVQTTDNIYVIQYTYSNITSIAFYFKKSSGVVDAGYRYEGTDPNNYVWFNNELWRIIGSVPTKIDSSGTTTNLVKIIRTFSISEMVWDKGGANTWETSSLYTLLNTYYYGSLNGISSTYCYSGLRKDNCDFSYNGIKPGSYYASMMKEVYWNTGHIDVTVSAGVIYGEEIGKQSVVNLVGLMNASDYGFAASYGRKPLNKYTSSDYTLSNYLYGVGFEWIINRHNATNVPLMVLYSGNLGVLIPGRYVSNTTKAIVRPVVYLESTVYVVSGDGTQGNPYKLGI